MKITAVDVFRVPVEAPNPPFIWRRGLPGSAGRGHGAVLQLRTDEGCDGVAFAPRYASSVTLPDVVDRLVRDVLLGEDPFQRELLWHKIWELDRVEELPLYLLGVVDTALWDLAGRWANQPTWQLLGGFRTEIEAYASTTTFGSIEEYLEIVDQCTELGYRADQAARFRRRPRRRQAVRCRTRAPGRRLPAHVRRVGRFRPAGRRLPGRCA